MMYNITGDNFTCRIPYSINMNLTNTMNCTPAVVCKIVDPYNSTNSLLKVSQCGYNNNSFYAYLALRYVKNKTILDSCNEPHFLNFPRSLGDLFTAAAVALLSASVVIATRETSTGRGDVGKQFAAGALGLGLLALIIGGAAKGNIYAALISFCILFVLAALILLLDQ